MERDDEPRPQGAGGERDLGIGETRRPGAAPSAGVPDGWNEAAPAAQPAPVTARPAPADYGPDDDDDEEREAARQRQDPGAIRAEDTEPYVGLQYVARLFKIVAMVVIVALTAEIVAALAMEGPDALFPLFLEVLQGAVLAALLWGASDLTLLFIDVGHDVRAARVLLGRMSARGVGGPPADAGDAARRRVERDRDRA